MKRVRVMCERCFRLRRSEVIPGRGRMFMCGSCNPRHNLAPYQDHWGFKWPEEFYQCLVPDNCPFILEYVLMGGFDVEPKKQEGFVELVVGDYSLDGHEQTLQVFVRTSATKEEFESAYQAGVKIVGVDWTKDIAESDGDRSVPDDVLKVLVGHGLMDEGEEWQRWKGARHTDCEEFARVWLGIAKLGNPELEFEVVYFDSINIGGYGLFGS